MKGNKNENLLYALLQFEYTEPTILKHDISDYSFTNVINIIRVQSGIFGQTAKFGQPPCLFHSSIIGMKNKLTKQTEKILMRRLIRSRLIWISTVCKCVSEFT